MKHFILTSFILMFVGAPIIAQINPTTIQDCIGAPALCFAKYDVPLTFRGSGQQQELLNYYDSNPSFCLLNGENNSAWFKFEVGTAGNVVFAIEPLSTNDDYDFAMFNLTGLVCTDIVNGTAPHVRCSYALTQGVSTGLAVGSTGTSAGPNGNTFLAPLAVDSGDVIYMVVDNFTRDGAGFVLDFTGSTAVTSYCDSLSFLTNGINKVVAPNPFDVYPNPTTGTVNITMTYSAQLLEMVDLNGKVVARYEGVAKGEQIRYSATHLPQGLYLLKATHAKGITTQKLQVLH